uniref:Uncharacterized protein n=1 Tax=Peronospora matthiolae TaxID=2874970 RepID=A0AAV1U476_9STRA
MEACPAPRVLLRRTDSPRPGGRSRDLEGGHLRSWMSPSGRYFDGLVFPTPCGHIGDRATRRGAAQAANGGPPSRMDRLLRRWGTIYNAYTSLEQVPDSWTATVQEAAPSSTN